MATAILAPSPSRSLHLCLRPKGRRDEGTGGRGDEGAREQRGERVGGREDEGARTYLSGHKKCVTDRREVILLWPMAISHLRPTAPCIYACLTTPGPQCYLLNHPSPLLQKEGSSEGLKTSLTFNQPKGRLNSRFATLKPL